MRHALIDHSPASPWPQPATSSATRWDRWAARHLQDAIRPTNVRIELWDGSSPFAGEPAIGDLVVRTRRALAGLIVNPELCFGEAYMAGRLDVRGSLETVVEALSRAQAPATNWHNRLAAFLAPPNSLRAARRNVHLHYDLGNDFYARWLDAQMVYTCAYFASPAMTLEQAQSAKLDLVCRKLQLRRGDLVVEAGCGWGALALHMARHYGARVKAFNISREQIVFARERADREGLGGAIDFIEDDYRNVSGTFDAFVSVGMLEHVGLRHFRSLGDVLQRVVRRDGGRGLLHFIGRDAPRPLNPWIRCRIFPGAYPPTLAEVTTRVLEPAGMSVVDVENLRLHYARTLSCWGERFAAARNAIRSQYGDEFARAWELYLAGSQAAFATGWMQLFQIVFSPRESAPPSWTRPSPAEVP
ncbi:MAG TPA: cyclopropane-fatty-acyl-phospholipid synthase family protein [Vicinamibacterales bacterium]|jgi:cyclopropane-fatty-acyl-phospholipid synthase